jgi:predicted glycosyl hydrolase (DUF1957 family)
MTKCTAAAIGYSRTVFDAFRNIPESVSEHFLELSRILNENQNIKLSCYFSGFWLENADPQTLRALSKLAQSTQLEVISGLYFEPDLSLLTTDEIEAHLRLTQEFWSELGIEKLSGVWLTNSSWHHCLEQLLLEHGIEYLVVPGEMNHGENKQETLLVPEC